MTSEPSVSHPKVESAIVGAGSTFPSPGKRPPATGETQRQRKEWGREWGGIVSDLAAQRRSQET